MRNLTLKQFKTVQAIISHGKIVSAAKALGLSPPALTIQLRQVEEEFQLALFDRTSD
ncbi:MAG: LysR family transcriptional regulator, partial [Mesorhizobium sp.]